MQRVDEHAIRRGAAGVQSDFVSGRGLFAPFLATIFTLTISVLIISIGYLPKSGVRFDTPIYLLSLKEASFALSFSTALDVGDRMASESTTYSFTGRYESFFLIVILFILL